LCELHRGIGFRNVGQRARDGSGIGQHVRVRQAPQFMFKRDRRGWRTRHQVNASGRKFAAIVYVRDNTLVVQIVELGGLFLCV
jgi:hypothetical protein